MVDMFDFSAQVLRVCAITIALSGKLTGQGYFFNQICTRIHKNCFQDFTISAYLQAV